MFEIKIYNISIFFMCCYNVRLFNSDLLFSSDLLRFAGNLSFEHAYNHKLTCN